MAMTRKLKQIQSVTDDLWDILKSARNVSVSYVTAWVARKCVYPYAFLLGVVTVIALFQLINLLDPPYAVAPRRSRVSDEIDYDAGNPGGPPVQCHWDILIVSSMRTLGKSPEYATLTSRMKRATSKNASTSSRQSFQMDLTCAGKPSQIPCSLNVVVSLNATDMIGKDAVIFGMPATTLKGKPSQFGADSPSKRKGALNQLWVLMAMLSPLEMRGICPELGGFPVHMVWSYMSASPLTTPFAAYVPGYSTEENSTASGKIINKGEIPRKRRLVAWMGNNCGEDAFWPRKAYLAELSRHIPVDMYGECSNFTCLPRSSEQCGMLMGQYKFFLAFETAECREYMTEQFWDTALEHHTVPVVYGPSKNAYLKLAPPNSFIHAADFDSPKALAAYLQTLDKNDGLYSRFFKWRDSGSIRKYYPLFRPESLCKLLPHIEDVKIGRLKTQPVSRTKWYGSCRSQRNLTVPQNTLKTWSPWR